MPRQAGRRICVDDTHQCTLAKARAAIDDKALAAKVSRADKKARLPCRQRCFSQLITLTIIIIISSEGYLISHIIIT